MIFVKGKKEKPTVSDAYKNAVMSIPALLNTPETEQYSFGKKAFMDWADSFRSDLLKRYSLNDKVWYLSLIHILNR